MGYQDWDDLGEKIQEIIDSAINENNYQKLSQNINQTVNKAIDNGSDALRDALNGAFKGNNGRESSKKGNTKGQKAYNSGPVEGSYSQNQDKSEYTYGMPGEDYYQGQRTGNQGSSYGQGYRGGNGRQGGSYTQDGTNGSQSYEARRGSGGYGGQSYGAGRGAYSTDGSYAYNPERNARAYETHKNHGYQQPPFGRRQRIEPQPKQETGLALYGRTTGEKVKGVLMTTFGGILTGGMGIGLIVTLVGLGIAGAGSAIGGAMSIGAGVLGAATAVGGVLLGKGCSKLGSLGRFQKYVKALGQHTYCNFEQLSCAVGKSVKYVKKDIKKMISRGWFLEGHVDKQETCLITSNETYQQYVETQKQLEMRAMAEKEEAERKAKMAAAQPEEKVSGEVQKVLDKGNEFLEKIRRSNDAIPGEEISRKISRMELIIQKIFERARKHPEIIPDLNKLMDYYLPMTVKLLNAYEDMDSQPIQGENITNSKKEIEETIDTLNIAFEKLLDSVFEDTAWDVSSDISVLHTVLAQEGLTEDDFAKMKKEAAMKEKV